MKSLKLLLTPSLLLFAACSASVSNDPFADFSDGRELKVSSEPLAGEVNSSAWAMGSAVARVNTNGEYTVTMAGKGVAMTCGNTFPHAPHLSFTIPGPGSYPYNSGAGVDQRVVNVIFPSTTPGMIGSDNVLASKSLIQIDSVKSGVLSGALSALSPIGAEESYSIAGKFQATVCNSVDDMPLFIRLKSASAFRATYSEAMKSSDGATYEVRIMDHKPRTVCDSFSSWMMTETPIKYVSLRTPAAVGAFTIGKGTLEYGDQGVSQGWSTDSFAGAGSLKSVSDSELLVSFKVKDFVSMGFEIEGALLTTICK